MENEHPTRMPSAESLMRDRDRAFEAIERMRPVYEAALAWERARQHAMNPDPPLFVERDSEELGNRMRAHSEREKELRALLRAALADGR